MSIFLINCLEIQWGYIGIFLIECLLKAWGSRPGDPKRTYEHIPYQISVKSLQIDCATSMYLSSVPYEIFLRNLRK